MKILRYIAIISTFICCTYSANAQVYDLSEVEKDRMMGLMHFDAHPGLTSGIFLNDAPNGKVEVKNAQVMTVGAGIYFGSEKVWVIPYKCSFYIEKKDDRVKLPVHVTNEGFWHESVIENNIYIIDVNGNKELQSSSRPLKGKIKGLKIKTNRMNKPLELNLKSNGQLDGGFVDIELIGRSEIHFTGSMSDPFCYIKLDKASLDILIGVVPKEDGQSILDAAH